LFLLVSLFQFFSYFQFCCYRKLRFSIYLTSFVGYRLLLRPSVQTLFRLNHIHLTFPQSFLNNILTATDNDGAFHCVPGYW
jgi:hypothetical protein